MALDEGDPEAALLWAAEEHVSTVEPTIASDEGDLVIALPGDPLHENETPQDSGLNRIVFRNGRWTMPVV